MMKEYRRRSILKAISWRITATLTTMIIVFIFTGEIFLSLGVGLVEVVSKMLFYYLHERLWGRISWGRREHPLAGLGVSRELASEDMEIIEDKLRDLGYLD